MKKPPFVNGSIYHIYNRGNGKMDIFRNDQDYFNFLKRLKLTLGRKEDLQNISFKIRIQPLPEHAFSVVCYRLMPNHFHLLVRQNTNIPISMLVNKSCSSYSKYFNKKYDHVGHLFQDQFKAIHIDNDEYLLWLSAYIHQNPKVAGIATLADYKWSSFLDYTGSLRGEAGLYCDKDIILKRFKSYNEYGKYVDDSYEIIKNRKFLDKIDLVID